MPSGSSPSSGESKQQVKKHPREWVKHREENETAVRRALLKMRRSGKSSDPSSKNAPPASERRGVDVKRVTCTEA